MIDEWLEKFNNEAVPLIVREYNPARIIFFGSRVSGKAAEDSDIDVIIISETFRNIPFVNRMGELLNLIWFPKHVDFLCYTHEEFERVKISSSVVRDALKTGVYADMRRYRSAS